MNLDSQILHALRIAGESGISGAELARQVGAAETAVQARLHELRALGYEITASPHLGYRLLSAPDLLHADDLISRLGETKVIGREIQVFQETTSTNDVIEKLARGEVKEGAVVFAESQTKGRGRLGRKWISPAGKGLWFSILLRPSLPPREVTQLTVASATALRRAIQSLTALAPVIKWPNDILLYDRKVAGILTELSGEEDRVKYVILGIGVDVNLDEGDFPAELKSMVTSLKAELGQPVPRAELATAIMRALDADYARICAGDFTSVANEWEEHCSTIGKDITIQTGGRRIRGRAESLGEDGALLLRTDHGHLERIIGGDVTLES
jgi:BirA family biotin operon repressor/biotin-[acetyl-CoA-carboxylase] ligase